MSLVRNVESAEFSQAVLAKSRRYIREHRVSPDPQSREVWWVRGSEPDAYRVGVIARGEDRQPWVACTCLHGRRVGAGECRCAHAAAVLEALHLLSD